MWLNQSNLQFCQQQHLLLYWHPALNKPAGVGPKEECFLSFPIILAEVDEEIMPYRMLGFHFYAFLEVGTSLETRMEWTLEKKRRHLQIQQIWSLSIPGNHRSIDWTYSFMILTQRFQQIKPWRNVSLPNYKHSLNLQALYIYNFYFLYLLMFQQNMENKLLEIRQYN